MSVPDDIVKKESDNNQDWTPGDVISAYEDGFIVLDDGTIVYNPIRAREFLKTTNESTRRHRKEL